MRLLHNATIDTKRGIAVRKVLAELAASEMGRGSDMAGAERRMISSVVWWILRRAAPRICLVLSEEVCVDMKVLKAVFQAARAEVWIMRRLWTMAGWNAIAFAAGGLLAVKFEREGGI